MKTTFLTTRLSEQEQIAFINELNVPIIDIESTQKLSIISLGSK